MLLVGYFFVCIFVALKVEKNASVAELVDALDSKSCSFGSAGSIPARGTKAPEIQGLFYSSSISEKQGLVITIALPSIYLPNSMHGGNPQSVRSRVR